MKFNRSKKLKPGQIQDRRGAGGAGGLAIGGGGLALVIAVIFVVIQALGDGGTVSPTAPDATSSDLSRCRTGADAQRSEDCRIVAFVNSIQDY